MQFGKGRQISRLFRINGNQPDRRQLQTIQKSEKEHPRHAAVEIVFLFSEYC